MFFLLRISPDVTLCCGLGSKHSGCCCYCVGQDDNFLSSVVKEREEELTKKTLESLNEMRIKFPGKTDTEAELLLDKVQTQTVGKLMQGF